MPIPTEEQLDTFALGCAKDMAICRAGIAAGYKPKSNAMYRRYHRPDFQARIAAHRRALGQAKTPDLIPIIERLVAAADKARAMDSAAAMKAACDLLAEAARLKRLLPIDEAAPSFEMTREEWLATFAPRPA
jgi:hypothetical protein